MPKQKRNKRIVLGVTGSFGSGKSTVARMFKAKGAAVIDADKLAHGCICPGSKAYRRIVSLFGADILTPKRTIDRVRLASAVFNDIDLLRKLDSIIHPEVIRNIKRKIKTLRSDLVVLDAPLLIEAGLCNIVDKLIVVKIGRDKQIKRIQERLSMGKAEISKRIRCQIPLKEKVRLADFVIDNDGSIGETRKQVAELMRRLWKITPL